MADARQNRLAKWVKFGDDAQCESAPMTYHFPALLDDVARLEEVLGGHGDVPVMIGRLVRTGNAWELEVVGPARPARLLLARRRLGALVAASLFALGAAARARRRRRVRAGRRAGAVAERRVPLRVAVTPR